MGSWLDIDVYVYAARGDVAVVHFLTAVGMRGSVGEEWPAAASPQVEARGATRRGVSGGVGQAGRVLKLVDQRLEQENHQQVSQQVRSGRAFINARGTFQAEQALQALEPELDAPAQTIESEHIGGRELLRRERSHQDHPICGFERLLGELMTFPLCISMRLASRARGGLCRLADGDQAQGERRAALATDPDRPVDQTARRCGAQLGDEIDRTTFCIAPAARSSSRLGSPSPLRLRAPAPCGPVADRRGPPHGSRP